MKMEQAVMALAALAHETRLQAFRQLVTAGPPGLAAGVLAEALGVAPATLSFHLKELSRAGLVGARRSGRQIFYAVDFVGTRTLFDFLMQDCCRGRPELCGPLPAGTAEACLAPRELENAGD
jgi:ArsR family transcriptional regulator, arsenate/arsenite/antimonite-responsive transcriptional repressor